MGVATRLATLAPLTAALLAAAAASAGAAPEATACLRDPACARAFVVAHRALGYGAPENSRAAVMACVDAGVPVIEVDVRRTADGELVLLHDATLDRTTTHQGAVRDLPFSTACRARLGNGEHLPRFEDVYAITRGRALLDVHAQDDVVEQLAEWIHVHGSFDDVLFFVTTPSELDAAARLRRRFPDMLVMPRAHAPNDVEALATALGGLPPAIHVDEPGSPLARHAFTLGVKIFVKTMSTEYVPVANRAAIRDAARAGATFLETDRPALALHALRPHHRQPKPAPSP